MGDQVSVDVDQLADFLLARAQEIEDEETAEVVAEQADEVREHASPSVLSTALYAAAAWNGHPDYRPEWQV